MTIERWTDEMLDSLTVTVRDMSQSIGGLATISENHARSIQGLEQSVVSLVDLSRVVIARMEEMQAEVRGLQTENRRILDQLINRNGDNG
jgi:methyl-accepting chemotaxis protein